MNYKNIILSSDGYYGNYGGKYLPEILRNNIEEVESKFNSILYDKKFLKDLLKLYQEISGRPTPLTPLNNLSNYLGGAKIIIKNEGLNHTGAHKINHCIGQILLAKKMGKKRIIAETGAGQHGYAVASVCARFQIPCTVYMGKMDYERQRPNVYWMELLGAKVISVDEGEKTLNDAVIAAFKDLIQNPDSYYLLGSAVGPHPYPKMNTFFQKIVSQEIKKQCQKYFNKYPDYIIACVGGGSNAMGAFFEFLNDINIQLIGVEAGGVSNESGKHASKIIYGKIGVFEGYKSYFIQDNDGNILPTYSISAGLDYCGISPILAFLYDNKRVSFNSSTDEEVLNALKLCAKKEGFILALESLHALAYAIKIASNLSKNQIIVVNASGRGEKDLFITMKHFQKKEMINYMKNVIKENI